MADLVNLTDKEFHMLSSLIHAKVGIILGDHKRSLVVGRLNKELRSHGFNSFSEYYTHVVNDSTGSAINTLIERISTNHTFFWRESDHFDLFRKQVLPELIEDSLRTRKNRIRIWCAGCSSGEEPYTLAMLIHECLGDSLKNWDVGVLATDVSSRVLEKAVRGVYETANVSKLPPDLKHAYFDRIDSEQWSVSPRIRQTVLFRKLNLMREEFPFRGTFQIVFCRNVMIYFDSETRINLVNRFHRFMDPGGYLFIGHSESLGRTNSLFRYICPAMYRKD